VIEADQRPFEFADILPGFTLTRDHSTRCIGQSQQHQQPSDIVKQPGGEQAFAVQHMRVLKAVSFPISRPKIGSAGIGRIGQYLHLQAYLWQRHQTDVLLDECLRRHELPCVGRPKRPPIVTARMMFT